MQAYFSARRRERIRSYLSGKTKGSIGRLIVIRLFCTLFTCALMVSLTSLIAEKLRLPLSEWLFIPILIWGVDISDHLWGKVHASLGKAIQVLTGIAACLVVAFFFAITNPNTKARLEKRWKQFHKEINDKLREKNRKSFLALSKMKGENWILLGDQKHLLHRSFDQAKSWCDSQGPGWELVSRERLSLVEPFPEFQRPTYVWTKGGGGAILITPGKRKSHTSMSANARSKHFVLCLYFDEASL